jgi:cytochrome P450
MTDPPHHARLRKPMNNAFSKSNVETIRAFVLARLQQLFETGLAR